MVRRPIRLWTAADDGHVRAGGKLGLCSLWYANGPIHAANDVSAVLRTGAGDLLLPDGLDGSGTDDRHVRRVVLAVRLQQCRLCDMPNGDERHDHVGSPSDAERHSRAEYVQGGDATTTNAPAPHRAGSRTERHTIHTVDTAIDDAGKRSKDPSDDARRSTGGPCSNGFARAPARRPDRRRRLASVAGLNWSFACKYRVIQAHRPRPVGLATY